MNKIIFILFLIAFAIFVPPLFAVLAKDINLSADLVVANELRVNSFCLGIPVVCKSAW